MNKSESKYFNTAAKMDEAFLELLGQKDLEFITIKELCEKAGVNRSTFYLHYENLGDLLDESMRYLIEKFSDRVAPANKTIVSRIRSCPLEELYLITPDYLEPYLNFFAEHRRLFFTVMKNAKVLRLDETYTRMFRHIFVPIMERFSIPERDWKYRMAFYINGLIAIVMQWLDSDCADPIEHIIEVMQSCALPSRGIADYSESPQSTE